MTLHDIKIESYTRIEHIIDRQNNQIVDMIDFRIHQSTHVNGLRRAAFWMLEIFRYQQHRFGV